MNDELTERSMLIQEAAVWAECAMIARDKLRTMPGHQTYNQEHEWWEAFSTRCWERVGRAMKLADQLRKDGS